MWGSLLLQHCCGQLVMPNVSSNDLAECSLFSRARPFWPHWWDQLILLFYMHVLTTHPFSYKNAHAHRPTFIWMWQTTKSILKPYLAIVSMITHNAGVVLSQVCVSLNHPSIIVLSNIPFVYCAVYFFFDFIKLQYCDIIVSHHKNNINELLSWICSFV